MDEQWRPVVGYEGLYEVSSEGRVRSIDRMVPHARSGVLRLRGKILKPGLTLNKNGGQKYKIVILSREGRHRTVTVHHLVADAFVPGREPDLEVRHLDGDADNCAARNLRWGTKSENAQDTVRHGRHNEARKTTCKRDHSLLDPTNVRVTKEGHRECRACYRVRRQAKSPAA